MDEKSLMTDENENVPEGGNSSGAENAFKGGEAGPLGTAAKKSAKKKNILRFLTGFVAGMATAIVVSLLVTVVVLFGFRKTPRSSIIDNRSLYKIDLLNTVLQKIYYEDISEDEVREGIYRGIMAAPGDKYTTYYTAEEMKLMNADWQGKFYGIGATLTIDPASTYTLIDSVQLGSPAEAAGLKAGDYIKEVDGTDVMGMSLTDVVQMVRGEDGTQVNLTIVRKGEKMELSITRGEITMDAVYYEKKEDNIGYIQLGTFSDVAVQQFAEKLDEAKKDKVKGLIIDLRGNPGGGLDVAVEICKQFMPAGLVVYTQDKAGKKTEYYCDGKNRWDIPLAVLVDGSSASASEIMTAAVKDSGAGTIVGVRTYGKGVYQSVIPIPDGSAVKVTSGQFFSPKGVCFHQVGIEPDVEVELDVDKYLKDKTDTQLEKAIEVVKQKIKDGK